MYILPLLCILCLPQAGLVQRRCLAVHFVHVMAFLCCYDIVTSLFMSILCMSVLFLFLQWIFRLHSVVAYASCMLNPCLYAWDKLGFLQTALILHDCNSPELHLIAVCKRLVQCISGGMHGAMQKVCMLLFPLLISHHKPCRSC